MAKILERVSVTYEATANATETYYFLTTAGLYKSDIATATGITGPTDEENYEDETLSTVKELIRSGIIVNLQVKIRSADGKTSRIKHIHTAATKFSGVAAALVGKSWPVGKGAGDKIYELMFPARIKSRL